MLIGIEGFLGDGKTIGMVRYLKNDYFKGRKVYANFVLEKIPYTYFNIDEFLSNENNDKLTNATIGIDEITTIMDCRLSGSKSNIAFGYLVLQSRKRNVDIYYTTQDLDLVDYKRLIKYTQIFIIAQRVYEKIELEDYTFIEKEVKNWRNYTIVDERQRKENIVSFNLDISPYYNDYNTDEIIRPPMNIKKNDLNNRIKKLETLLKQNGIKYDK